MCLIVAAASWTTGCAAVASPVGLRFSVARPQSDRPAVNPDALSPAFKGWLGSLLKAQESNCTTLDVLNGKAPEDAAKGCVVP